MRSNARPVLLGLVGMLVLFLSAPQLSQAQVTEVINRGKMWHGVMENGGSGYIFDYQKRGDRTALSYPGMGSLSGSYGSRSTQWFQSSGEGLWILTKDGSGFKVYSSGGPRYNSEGVFQVDYPVDQEVEKDLGFDNASLGYEDEPGRLSYDSPNYWANASSPPRARPANIHNFTFGQYVDAGKDMYGEQIVIARWQAGPILGTRKGRVWSYPDYDDFIIYELTFENTSSAPLNDTYFAVDNIFRPAQPGHIYTGGYGLWWGGNNNAGYDDHYKYTGAPDYVGPSNVSAQAIANARMSYSYDGDYPLSPADDTGEPLVYARLNPRYPNEIPRPEGTLLSAVYVGFATIDADPTDGFAHEPDAATKYVAPKGNAAQPAAVNWYKVNNKNDYTDPNEGSHSDEQLYQMITAPTPANPTDVTGYAHTQAYGPYDLAPGEKAKVVVAYVGGQASGHDKYKGVVEPYDYQWMFEGKKDEIPLGEEVLFKHLARAQNAYALEYDLPDSPPDVALTVNSNADGNFDLSWPGDAMTAKDPDYTGDEAMDVRGFRVYVSRRDFFGPWELAATIPTDPKSGPGALPANTTYENGKFTWTDKESLPGFGYYYMVRTFDSGHTTWTGFNGKTIADLPADVQEQVRTGLESGHSSSYQHTNTRGVRPVMISSSIADKMEIPIQVVPNPFHLTDGNAHYQASANFRFTNVPHHARISIYSVAGNLIAAKIHDNPDQGEAVWNQNTMHSGTKTERLGSGVYFWVVESLVPSSQGKTQVGTLMIIR